MMILSRRESVSANANGIGRSRNINFSAVEMDTKIEENRCRISSSPNCSQKRITEVADLSSSANWPPKCKSAKSVMSKKFPLSALRSFPTQRVELEHAIDRIHGVHHRLPTFFSIQ